MTDCALIFDLFVILRLLPPTYPATFKSSKTHVHAPPPSTIKDLLVDSKALHEIMAI